MTVIAGKRDQLAGVLQERYGYAKEQVDQELDKFTKELKLSYRFQCRTSLKMCSRIFLEGNSHVDIYLVDDD